MKSQYSNYINIHMVLIMIYLGRTSKCSRHAVKFWSKLNSINWYVDIHGIYNIKLILDVYFYVYCSRENLIEFIIKLSKQPVITWTTSWSIYSTIKNRYIIGILDVKGSDRICIKSWFSKLLKKINITCNVRVPFFDTLRN